MVCADFYSLDLFMTFFWAFTTAGFFTSSPPQLCPNGRTSDINALISVMNNAQE